MKFSNIPKFTPNAPYQVNTSWASLEDTLDRYTKNYNLDCDPDFQRGHVWSDLQRSRYVEFVLRGGQSSKDIYFNCPGWQGAYDGSMVLVDGKQRLEAVCKFLRSEIPAFGCLYKDYEDKLPFFGVDFIFHVNNLPTRKQVLQWYLDLNDGGVVHTKDELDKVRHLLEKETCR